jgi:hypothetical protein
MACLGLLAASLRCAGDAWNDEGGEINSGVGSLPWLASGRRRGARVTISCGVAKYTVGYPERAGIPAPAQCRCARICAKTDAEWVRKPERAFAPAANPTRELRM